MRQVAIMWQCRSALIQNGYAAARHKGDVDVVDHTLASRLERIGYVTIKGPASDIPKVGGVE